MSQPALVHPALTDLRTQLKASIQERDALIDGMLVALLAKETLFILGPPGTAKSLVCTALCNVIGGEYFQMLMSKVTMPEEIFGPWSMQGLKEDRYKRITKGKLPEAHVAFLDEMFKSSSMICNTLLTAINERHIYNDGIQQIPLQTLFAASNELPSGEELGAFYDRFVLRYAVDILKDNDNFKAMFDNDLDFSKLPKLPLAELEQLQAKIRTLPISKSASAKVVELRNQVQEKGGMYVSDRKWKQSKNIIRAWAYLEGHAEVEVEDLTIIENILWSSPDQIPEIRALVRKLCNPLAETVQRHMDSANTVMSDFKKKKIPGMEAFQKLQQSKNALEEEYAKSPKEFVLKAAGQIGEQCKALSEVLFKSNKAPATTTI